MSRSPHFESVLEQIEVMLPKIKSANKGNGIESLDDNAYIALLAYVLLHESRCANFGHGDKRLTQKLTSAGTPATIKSIGAQTCTLR